MLNVLVVDNSDIFLKLMNNFLTKEGHTVQTAEDGITALKLMEHFQPHIIFIDLVMPNLDGDKLCRVIRNNPKFSGCFIVIISAIAAEQSIDCTEFGANICIAKGPYGEIKKHVFTVIDLFNKFGTAYRTKSVLGLDSIYEREITKELLFSKSHFEITIAHLDEGFLELNRNRQIIFVNPAATKLLGKSAEDLLSASFSDLFAGETRDKLRTLLADLDANPRKLGEDPPIIHNRRKLVLNFLPVLEPLQESIIVMIHDVTERKHLEGELQKHQEFLEELITERTERLRESEEKYRQLFNENTDAVVIFDVQTLLIEESNQAAVKLLGCSREKMLTMRATDLFLAQTELGNINRKANQASRDSIHLPEAEIKRLDGSLFPAELRLGFFEANQRKKVIASIRDITLRKKLEMDLRQAQKMEAIGTLAGGIAHDFNNILTAIMAHSEVAQAALQSDKKPFLNLQEIIKASGRAKELVKQILTFSRMTDKSLQPLEIHFIVKEVLNLIRATTPTSIEILEKISPDCGRVLADPTQIHQLVINLCSNAIDAMPGRGKLEVHLYKLRLPDLSKEAQQSDLEPGDYIKLSVIDTGCGIDEKIRHRIFEPFFTTKDIGKGTGMGLSMVHGIVQNHRGAIAVESSPGKGSAFHILFPVCEEEIEKFSVVSEPLPTGCERILLVDDEQSILAANQSLLARLGYVVTTKDQPLEALRLFKERPDNFDLVITDQAMPDLTGDELAVELLRIRPDLPVLLVTGYSSMLDGAKIKDYGIRELIMKPISPTNLARQIRKVMDS